MLDLKVIRTRQTNYPEVFKAINRAFLPEAGIVLQKAAMDAAAKDSGRLKGSIKYKVNFTKDQVAVGTNVEYAPYVEYGTVKMKAQPFLRTALDLRRKELVARWADIYSKVFRVLGGRG